MSNKHSAPRARFKTAEGRFHLVAERTNGLVPFHYMRSTRLTFASLQGGGEEGTWVIYNVGDYLHISRHDAMHKEPTKQLKFDGTSKTGQVVCHAFSSAAKDGIDLLVGCNCGSVALLSLRAQLVGPPISNKPAFLHLLTPEASASAANTNALDASRCSAVAWVPKGDTSFVAAYNTGNIYLYKKSAITGGEAPSKSLLSMGSSRPSSAPAATFTINGGGINDIAVSPDGTKAAAACRDGALRLLDLVTGNVVGGYQSYYGAMLCCCFSPDGAYVAAGGEDDLVSLYGVTERYPVVHCEAHSSWVSRVQFDPWSSVTHQPSSQSPASDLASSSRIYRLASVGHDGQLCLWDVQIPSEGDFVAASLLASMGPMKRPPSMSSLALAGSRSLPSNALDAILGNGPMGASISASKSTGQGHSRSSSHVNTAGIPHGSHHDRKQSLGKAAGICPSLPRADMYIHQPIMQHRLHLEPMTDVLLLQDVVLTADGTGCIKAWSRPQPLSNASAASSTHGSINGGTNGSVGSSGRPSLTLPS